MTLPLWFASDTDVPDTSSGGRAARAPTSDIVAPTIAETDAILHRLRAGDVDALTALFDTHTPALISFATAMLGGADAARDVVQDVFFDLWDRRERLIVRTTIRAYLFAATRGRALQALRATRIDKRYRDEHRAQGTWLVPDAPARPDEIAEQTELSQRIAQTMTTLTPRVRAVAELRWYGRMSYAEIASVLGVSERTVNNQLTTAAKILRTVLAAR